MSELGLMQVYTGAGKGKTTAALGLTLRAWGRGLRVCIIQFMKVGEDYGEIMAVRKLAGVDLFQFGREVLICKGEHTTEDLRLARKGLQKASEALTSGDYDIVIMDEVNDKCVLVSTYAEAASSSRARLPGTQELLSGEV